MPNASNPQLMMGSPTGEGEGYIDVDNARRLNLNVLSTQGNNRGSVRVGQGGLEIVAGGDITLGAGNLVDGVDISSPTLSITVANNKYQLVNDVQSPGANMYYGTDSNGNKGWFALP